MKRIIISYISLMLLTGSCGSNSSPLPEPPMPPEPGLDSVEDVLGLPSPDPLSRKLYNGITLPPQWPPHSNYSDNITRGMVPFYLQQKPAVIDITMGRQLFVDDFLIAQTDLKRTWHRAEFYGGNPVLAPETEWERSPAGGAFAAPFSDGVWYDEQDQKFKMWYMAGGGNYNNGNPVTCYVESSDGIKWTRPSLRTVTSTNIVFMSEKTRDSNTVWVDKRETNASARYKMLQVYGGAGNWKYHYCTSADGLAWREQNESNMVADRSTAYYNSFRGVWVWSMRHNVRVDASNLIRARDYMENADIVTGNRLVQADLQRFWFGPWPNEPKHPDFPSLQPAIYNHDAIAYESILLGTFSVWSGPENDVCAAQNIIKRNQLLLGFSRDGWNWYREDFEPFCPVSDNKSSWNNGNVQSSVGSPIIVGDKLYFYMSGRRLNNNNQEIVSTGLAMLRRDGFASMDGTGTLTTESITFTGKYFYVNATGSLQVELLHADGSVIEGFSRANCQTVTGDSTKARVVWNGNNTLESLKGQTIKVKFYLNTASLYSFWISQYADGRSYGYTGGGGVGLGKYGIDM